MKDKLLKINLSPATSIYFLFLLLFMGMLLTSLFIQLIPSSNAVYKILLTQLVSSVLVFLLPTSVYLLFAKVKGAPAIFRWKISIVAILFTILLLPVATPFISVFNVLNSFISFETVAPALQTFFDTNLANSQKMLEDLSGDKSVVVFLLSLFVLAVMPAIVEELFFRASLQSLLLRAIKYQHLAIWIGALVFSLMHMQLEGFFVRMLLGVLLGYLYYYSKNILYPMLLHFVNNARVVIVLFLSKNFPDMEAMNNDTSFLTPWFYVLACFSLVGTVAIFYYFYKYSSGKSTDRGI